MDTALIKECIVYAQSVAAQDASFKAAPDGSSKHAEPLADRHSTRAQHALTKIATMTASSPAALQAKARIMPMVIDDNSGLSMGEADEAFYRSFAADVKAFLEPLVRSDWLADRRKGSRAGELGPPV